ncbi:hypothetical protein [Frigoriflavimonas asaccharolytica]|uniref:Uncharacterized protein n=1 Tax=Frigoriflavimonas asaccharolytica TaxID=2735899 RepID=A0A8J8G4E4_9FLAO|nr:hypothetical protein [Frigoriflavimonas asaccharolytica]NRS91258.1 hypothetical protein [Frigoriflavimonas asaccharolytica]
MKKLKILKNEVRLQMVLSAIAAIICLVILGSEGKHEAGIIYFASLFLIGIFNVMGFIVRSFLIDHKFNKIYSYSVIGFFVLFYILLQIDEDF